MPLTIKPANAAPVAPSTGTLTIRPRTTPVADSVPQDGDTSTGPDLAGSLVGAGLVGAAGMAMHNPAAAKSLIGKGLKMANNARMTLMLSGMAPLKSLLGNVGATAIESMERGTLAPLKELVSGKTLEGFKQAWKAPASAERLGYEASKLNLPGRFMGAADEATRGAMTRAGMSAQEAERAVLQAPLQGRLGEVLDSPAGKYLVPFRRTPVNQFIEGFDVMKGGHPAVLAGVGAAGAAHGYATADEQYPVSIGLGSAAASKYGLPYALAAYLGRRFAGAKKSGGIESQVLPVSEYGIKTALDEPLRPFLEPAALSALRQLRGK